MAMVQVDKKLWLVTTFEKDSEREVSKFLRDFDKDTFAKWILDHLLWAYSQGYDVHFDIATEQDVEEMNTRA